MSVKPERALTGGCAAGTGGALGVTVRTSDLTRFGAQTRNAVVVLSRNYDGVGGLWSRITRQVCDLAETVAQVGVPGFKNLFPSITESGVRRNRMPTTQPGHLGTQPRPTITAQPRNSDCRATTTNRLARATQHAANERSRLG